jgi:putative transposase
MPDEPAKHLALFRYQVIAPLLAWDGPRGTLRQAITALAARTHDHPYKGPVRLSFATIEEWLYLFKRNGFEGLLPRRRKDRGHSRKIDDALAETIEHLAEGRPELDGPGLLAELRTRFAADQLPSLSTLYRFLRARGLDQRKAPARRDHRAYAFEQAGDCWQADVMYGPTLATPSGTRRRTYLLAVLDDASRLVPHAQFYFHQHLRTLKDCLKQAFLKRGLPKRLYVDNGRIFRSRLILHLGARLGIHILHTRPYQPQGRAKIERWFRTVRAGFLKRLDVNTLEDLDHLNRLFLAWVEGQYHQRPHRGLEGETPLDRWVRLSDAVRALPGDVDLEALFLEETRRRVAKNGTFALKGKVFEAGVAFIGQRVSVRFDPFDLRRVVVVGANGEPKAAFPVDLHANRRLRRAPPEATPTADPPPLRALEDLAEQMDPRPDKEDPDDE